MAEPAWKAWAAWIVLFRACPYLGLLEFLWIQRSLVSGSNFPGSGAGGTVD
ncbi:MAG: hypothetical protein ACFB0E_16070 [Leptolyngbyaceae cyanobacterium]